MANMNNVNQLKMLTLSISACIALERVTAEDSDVCVTETRDWELSESRI